MKHLLLFRHGEVEARFRGRYIGRTDAALSAAGREACAALAGKVPEPERIYTSPLIRAQESAEAIFPGRKLLPDDRLCEIDFGILEGLSFAEIVSRVSAEWLKSWAETPEKTVFPEGESVADFYRRADDFFDRLPEDGLTAVVTHGGVLARVLGKKGKLAPVRYGEVLPLPGSMTEVFL